MKPATKDEQLNKFQAKMLRLLEAIAYQTSGGQMEFHDYVEKIYTQTMHKRNEVDHAG